MGELADRGVDGIYFDNRHMPDVCSGTELPTVNTADGWRVSVPAFQTGACVVAEY